MDEKQLWQRYRKYLCVCPEIDLMLDISRMHFDDDFFEPMAEPMRRAYEAMQRLEAGEIANPDENRRVGHYWLRDASRAPNAEIREAIEGTLLKIERFAAEIHAGQIRPQTTDRFTDVLVIGIGGSALGPQLAADALGDPGADRMRMHFFDNTDPDGIDRVLRQIGGSLPSTLTLVISKGGSTPETRNGMILARKAYEQRDLDFVQHAVAVTGEGSALDKLAEKENWAHRLPMWDWVGGRTSQTAAVGLLPAALQGCDITALLDGAARCDQVTRATDTMKNPAALMALMWHHATNGRGEKDMVILPYKDRLQLFSRYLQQLVMESLGKGKDLDDKPVKQGIAVYGNKGSTDQHAYVQQLREGVDNFFATFIRVLEDGGGAVTEVESSVTAGDYLHGFLLGTREALYENDRQSLTITIERVDAFSLGVLIALFERAVGYYATLVNINAYHQPGVEAGKKAAASVLELQKQVVGHLQAAGQPLTADQIAAAIDRPQQVEHVLHILQHLAANGRIHTDGQADHPAEQRYSQ